MTNAIIEFTDNMLAQDCFAGIKSEYPEVEIENTDNTITMYGDHETISQICAEIEEGYKEYEIPDINVYDEEEYDTLDVPDTYEMDDTNNPTYKESKMKSRVMYAKKLLEHYGYTVRKPIDEEFDYDSASDEDQLKYNTAVGKLVDAGAAKTGPSLSREWSDEEENEFATTFAQKTRFLRVAINDDFKKEMNQKYGYPVNELVQYATQMVDEYLDACDGTPDPEAFREYVEENLP